MKNHQRQHQQRNIHLREKITKRDGRQSARERGDPSQFASYTHLAALAVAVSLYRILGDALLLGTQRGAARRGRQRRPVLAEAIRSHMCIIIEYCRANLLFSSFFRSSSRFLCVRNGHTRRWKPFVHPAAFARRPLIPLAPAAVHQINRALGPRNTPKAPSVRAHTSARRADRNPRADRIDGGDETMSKRFSQL